MLRFTPPPPPSPFPNPLFPSPLLPFKPPILPLKTLTLSLTRAFYTERTAIPLPSKPPAAPSEADAISALNDRIRRDLPKREGPGSKPERELDPKVTEKYIKLVKEQQQRGLMKLKGEREGEGSGLGYRVDPYTLRPGDYVVHKKVGIGRFVAIKYDVARDEKAEPVE